MRDDVRRKLDDAILYLFQEIRYPVFPLNPEEIVRNVYRCGYITYDELAAASKTGYRDVVKSCESLDGCTQYDPATGRYLVAINTSDLYGASRARIRWTTSHELGHIAAGHFIELAESGDRRMNPSDHLDMEEEADYFAAAFLAPIPAMRMLRVKRPADIRDWFGLSQTAAEYRWTDFHRQREDQRLTDYFRLFRPRSKTKEFRAFHPKGIDVSMDPSEPRL